MKRVSLVFICIVFLMSGCTKNKLIDAQYNCLRNNTGNTSENISVEIEILMSKDGSLTIWHRSYENNEMIEEDRKTVNYQYVEENTYSFNLDEDSKYEVRVSDDSEEMNLYQEGISYASCKISGDN